MRTKAVNIYHCNRVTERWKWQGNGTGRHMVTKASSVVITSNKPAKPQVLLAIKPVDTISNGHRLFTGNKLQ
ncbi:hypothetical protein OTK01_000317 [Caldicellulosiruptor acetigenus]|uniref:hypothetical protein n=1 Tax=Caldicellulosiruptor acetigenus TaxID=301953 RepID=UPI0022A9888E|nr:hypothetical protein [Caldicellulosiruptor acetigenus]WAM36543.1 hypothetical protein OTK01_000317 [Caldicellulosiruptor acetigenus]